MNAIKKLVCVIKYDIGEWMENYMCPLGFHIWTSRQGTIVRDGKKPYTRQCACCNRVDKMVWKQSP